MMHKLSCKSMILCVFRGIGLAIFLFVSGCSNSAAVEGADIQMRGMEYDGISLKQLLSIYKASFEQAGFELKKKTINKRTKEATLHFDFSIGASPDNLKGMIVMSFNFWGSTVHKCDPCSEIMESRDADSEFLKKKMYSAYDKAKAQIESELGSHIRYNQADHLFARYVGVSPDDLISAYKQAYIEQGFEFDKIDALNSEKEGKYKAEVFFRFLLPEYPGFRGMSVIFIDLPSARDEMCAPCYVDRERLLRVYPEIDSDERRLLKDEMARSDEKAREQAEIKLDGYIRRPRDYKAR